MSAWAEHVSAALLGTQRRAVPSLAEAPADAGDGAARLLDQAALLTVRRRAGWLPETAEPIAPAPAEVLPVVAPAAARRLRRILGGERPRLLPEWLAAAAGSGRRVPPQMLPELLDKGRADRSLRPHIARAAGRRGVWLAMQNLDWAYLVAVSDGDATQDPRMWETGTRAERIAHLSWLRATAPEAAVATLRTTWARDSAPDRALFLATFERDLSPGDEEFLEEALDDRGQDVRRIAADLLARLPDSAYAGRMAERARACLRRPAAAPGEGIIVEPPADHDEAMQRDGIPFHAVERVGARAGWLREILARSPLGIWAEVLGRDPDAIVRLPINGVGEQDERTARDVHLGWARATLRQHDATWARALLTTGVLLDEIAASADLLSVLPAGDRDRTAADLVLRIGGPAFQNENAPHAEDPTRTGSTSGSADGSTAGPTSTSAGGPADPSAQRSAGGGFGQGVAGRASADPLGGEGSFAPTEVLLLLERVPGPWGGELADVVIAALAAAEENGDVRFLADLCRLAEERLSPSLQPDDGAAERRGSPPETAGEDHATGHAARSRDSVWRLEELALRHPASRALGELAEALRFRHDMLDELRHDHRSRSFPS